eukprot:TRINITY_DN2820_c0_g1_i2.p1 TRINITY_DN2820_c0_g1~~TRINITY_DN2820_c0_g1_i2.p1  ORF type:complete len:242 (-),score=63.65 TRINITY_DN2820_c0_g1_i2:175-861(-)
MDHLQTPPRSTLSSLSSSVPASSSLFASPAPIVADQSSHCVVPGERLGYADDFQASLGTYVRKQYIHASVVGFKHIVPGSEGEKPSFLVLREKETSVVPIIGNIVTAKVTRINLRQATLKILCVGSKPVKEAFQGVIRVQDVRATEVDKVQLYKCFRPGDVVRAEVISLGDKRSYYLSTAKNELGVIFAKSVAGATMIPISWEQMQCPKTKMKEFRKVAKVVAEESLE